jgi:signal transduction histidine kinase
VAGGLFVAFGVALTAAVLVRGGGLSVLLVAVTPLPGWSFGLAGALACLRERWRRTGLLLLAAGVAWFVHLADWTHVPVLITAAAPWHNAYAAVFAHLILAFPDGHLGSRGVRLLVAAGYLDAVGVHAAATVFGGAFYHVEVVGGVVLAALAVAVLARRGRLPTAVWVSTLTAFVALVANLVSVRYALAAWVVFSLALAAVPFAFLGRLLGVRLRRAGVARLLVRLGHVAGVGELRDALADALHDPTLRLAFWVPDRDGFVNAYGQVTALPDDGGPVAATLVERDGRRIGALVHDAALHDDPDLVAAVASAAGMALENARLQAELRARFAELALSRSRVVEAAAAERRRIERNLHDGAQQRLVSVAFTLGLARSRLATDPAAAGSALAEARTGLTQALDELRRLGQGIHPGILIERGLHAAIAELAITATVPVRVAWAAPERLPDAVESTGYYVVAELLANASKHANATEVRVEVAARDAVLLIRVTDDGTGGADPRRGSGLRGLADRVAALDGRLTVAGPPGSGTTIEVELPCG